MIQKIVHPIAGEVKITGNPIKMSGTNPKIYASSPLLGEHTDYVINKYVQKKSITANRASLKYQAIGN